MSDVHSIPDPRCMRCWTPKSSHSSNENGALVCPPTTGYFTACDHKNRHGSGSISSDGKVSGQSYCLTCGETFQW